MSLFRELQYRNVFRVAIAYCAVGWLVAQVADLAAENFGAPDWFMRMLLIVLLLGLPVALFLAWAYELTPAGVVRAGEVPEDAPKDPRSRRILNRVIIAALVVAVIALAVDRTRLADEAGAPAAGIADKSIAILPFADFSPGGDQAWFADGLAEEILNALARIDDLRVASRTSAFAYRGTQLDVPTIAAELGVAHILEGSVRRAGDRIRVTAQLIRAADDKHLWSNTFDGDSDDSITIQETIARSIAQALDTAMDPAELERMIDAGTSSIEAWETFLKARSLMDEVLSDYAFGDRLQAILALLHEATAIDPGFFDAQMVLANLYLAQLQPSMYAAGNVDLSRGEARRLALEALDAAASHARSELARLEVDAIRAELEIRLLDRVALLEEAAVIAGDDRDILISLGAELIKVGEFGRAAEVLRRAATLEMEPGELSSYLFQYLARVDLDAALPLVDAALETPSPAPGDLYQGHRVYLYAGRVADAAKVASAFLRRSGTPAADEIVRIRQACAEGRVEDAHAIYAQFAERLAESGLPVWAENNWLYLRTLGRNDEARAALLPLDTPDGLYSLSGYLSYTHFDPDDYPLLRETLGDQGIRRPPPAEIPFACRR